MKPAAELRLLVDAAEREAVYARSYAAAAERLLWDQAITRDEAIRRADADREAANAYQELRDVLAKAQRPAAGRACRLEDRQFALMQQVFGESGGICDGDRVGRLMRPHWDQPVSVLARWIVDRRVVSFGHQGSTWIPTFQFDPESMHLDPNAARVIDELAPAFDDWELALWFASPNEALDGAAPVSVITADPDAVLAAARVDRFIALG